MEARARLPSAQFGRNRSVCLKTIFGATLRAKEGLAQDTETMLRLDALNRMTMLGMPQSYAI